MSKGHTLQDPFLNTLRKERIPVSIYLVSGIKLEGQIESFDQFVILLKNAVSQMVYKHAISTVVPARMVKIPMQNQGDGKDDDGRTQSYPCIQSAPGSGFQSDSFPECGRYPRLTRRFFQYPPEQDANKLRGCDKAVEMQKRVHPLPPK